MKSLISCHIQYMFSKATYYLVASTTLIVLIMIFIFASNANTLSDNNISRYYFENCFSIISTILLFITIFIFAFQFSSRQDQYSHIIIGSQISKAKYCISKMIVLTLIMTVIYIIYCSIIILVFLFFLKHRYLEIEWIIKFANIYLELVYFGFLSMLFVQIMDNIYVIFVVFGIYLLVSATDNTFIRVISCRTNQYGMYEFPYLFVFAIIALIIIVNLLIFIKKDVK